MFHVEQRRGEVSNGFTWNAGSHEKRLETRLGEKGRS
jgi:hypothetical protein